MPAAELLRDLDAAGVSVAVEGAALRVRPASKLTPELRARLQAEKPAMVELLSVQAVLQRIIEHGEWAQPADLMLVARASVRELWRRGDMAALLEAADELAELLPEGHDDLAETPVAAGVSR